MGATCAYFTLGGIVAYSRFYTKQIKHIPMSNINREINSNNPGPLSYY